MPYARTTVESAIKAKLDSITADAQNKFSTDPPTQLSPSDTNALLAAAVAEAIDVLVKTAIINIPIQPVPALGLIAPTGPVTGTLVIPAHQGTIT